MFQSIFLRGVIFSVLFFSTVAIANPRIVRIEPILSGPISLHTTPIRLLIEFSEPVYGFRKEDIWSNGRILALEGGESTYSLLVIASSPQLVVDIYTDAVRNIEREGNELAFYPFIAHIQQDGSLIIEGSRSPIQPRQVVQEPEPPPPPQPPPEQPPPPPPEQPPQPLLVIVETPVVVEDKPQGSVKANFLFNFGAYNDAFSFINIEEQTDIEPEQTAELMLGMEVRHRFRNWRQGFAYFLNLGYQQSSYSAMSGDAEGSYTAIPIHLGTTLFLSDYFSTSVAAVIHLDGEYTHTGRIGSGPVEDYVFNVEDGANNNDAGQPGILVDLNFGSNSFSVVLRYLSISLNNFENIDKIRTDFLEPDGLIPDPLNKLNTLHSVQMAGLFFKINL